MIISLMMGLKKKSKVVEVRSSFCLFEQKQLFKGSIEVLVKHQDSFLQIYEK